MRRIVALGLMTMLVGCEAKDDKPNPLRRVGSVAPPPKVEKGDKGQLPVEFLTLYERLGQEDGLKKAAAMALADPAVKELTSKVTPQQLSTLLVEASSGEALSNVPVLSGDQWDQLKLAIRGAFLDLGIPGADRDEIIDRLSKKR
jgi:hypothetical protein